jgi:flavin-dependent thymidylate synthase
MTKDVQKWADVAMFKAAPIDKESGPRVQLLSCNSDPLGTIAAAAKMYKGEYVETLAQITDDERRHYLSDVRKNVLAAPLEFVNFHFIISGVTRGFTHQMVRQRTATYTQESTRFAVKEDVPVGYPPSITGARMKQEENWKVIWDDCVRHITEAYNSLVNSGMPAEDARGLLPTNLLTRINYNTSLRGLLEHAGLRLCTQAQFEWRLVWARMMEAIRDYGVGQQYDTTLTEEDIKMMTPGYNVGFKYQGMSSQWQFEELSKIFKPICYQKGSCQFLSDVDRACTIRDRVQDFAKHNIPSSSWNKDIPIWPKDGRHWSDAAGDAEHVCIGIQTEEWMLDPAAARISQ